MQYPALNLAEPHHDAEELLPWYATGKLEDDDRALVEKHLSSCAHCRRRLAAERRMIDEFARLSPEIDSGWARLKQRIEGSQARRGLWGKIRGSAAEVWQNLSRPAIATLAAAQLVFVVLAGALLLSLGRPDYRALGSAPAPQSANIIAMFDPGTTELQLRELLKANGASVVGGPTTTGAYLLNVSAPSRATVLDRLRGNRHVLMAQPIDGPAS